MMKKKKRYIPPFIEFTEEELLIMLSESQVPKNPEQTELDEEEDDKNSNKSKSSDFIFVDDFE